MELLTRHNISWIESITQKHDMLIFHKKSPPYITVRIPFNLNKSLKSIAWVLKHNQTVVYSANRIPFGIDKSTEGMVEIGNAKRGKACNCYYTD